jgi:uncharacterized protein YcbK (DUF882 family)
MHNVCSIALASVFAISSCASAHAQSSKKPIQRTFRHEISLGYTLQTVSVRANCFPAKLRGILSHIAAKTGHRPLITSGYRPHSHREGSLHRKCIAADIRVPGVSERTIIAAAKTAPGIGGVGSYCNGIVHVDVGPQRRWVHC